MSRTSRAAALLALALATIACDKDAQVNRDLDALDKFSKDVLARVEGASDPAAGIDAAMALVEQSRGDVAALVGRLGSVSESQMSAKTKDRYLEVRMGSGIAIQGLRIKLMRKTQSDPKLERKLDALIDAYTKVVLAE